MATTSVPTRVREATKDEVRRTVLREAVQRFNHELLDEEEWLLLWDRIVRLRKRLGLT